MTTLVGYSAILMICIHEDGFKINFTLMFQLINAGTGATEQQATFRDKSILSTDQKIVF